MKSEPLVCAGCGQRILRRDDNFQEHTENGVTRAWHILDRKCGPPWARSP